MATARQRAASRANLAKARAAKRKNRGYALADRAYGRAARASSQSAALRWQRRGMRHEARASGRKTPRGQSKSGTWPSQVNRSGVLSEARRTGRQQAAALKAQRRSQDRWDAWTGKGRTGGVFGKGS